MTFAHGQENKIDSACIEHNYLMNLKECKKWNVVHFMSNLFMEMYSEIVLRKLLEKSDEK